MAKSGWKGSTFSAESIDSYLGNIQGIGYNQTNFTWIYCIWRNDGKQSSSYSDLKDKDEIT